MPYLGAWSDFKSYGLRKRGGSDGCYVELVEAEILGNTMKPIKILL